MKWLLFYSTFILCLANTSLAQRIVKDVNDIIADIATYVSFRIFKMTNPGEKIHFVANDASSDNEPRVAYGTEAVPILQNQPTKKFTYCSW